MLSYYNFLHFVFPPQRLSTTTVPFTVLSVTSNLCSEEHFAVCGLRVSEHCKIQYNHIMPVCL